jgi:hypothetical protein
MIKLKRDPMIKNYICFLMFLMAMFFFSCQSKNSNLPENAIDPQLIENPASATSGGTNSKKAPVFKFDEEVHDFGTLTDGEKVSYAFHFTNVGNADLVIRAAQGSCGCTVPEFPKDPIKPGEDGIVNVTFNSEGKVGQQLKTITMISNTVPNTYIISIKANVLKAQ